MFIFSFYMINALEMFDKRIKNMNLLFIVQIIFIALKLSFCWEGGKSFFFENFNKKKYFFHNINVNKNNLYININVD